MDRPLDDEALRAAMDVVLTWGPERSRPEVERLAERRPDLDPSSLAEALAAAHEVLRRAEVIAPATKGFGPVDDSAARVRADHPWLTDELWSRAANQGLYADWRDHGR